MTDLRQHYAAVRARLNKAPAVALASPPQVSDVPVSVDVALNRYAALLAGCPLPRRLQRRVLRILAGTDVSWRAVTGRECSAVLFKVRREVFEMLREEGWSLKRASSALGKKHAADMHRMRGNLHV